MQKKHWEILYKNKRYTDFSVDDVVGVLLKNRSISRDKTNLFFNPPHPNDIKIKETGISEKQLDKAIKRISQAKKNKETVVVFGDYDADGVTATAILWEALYRSGVNTMPYIPDRFEEGYGIKPDAIIKIKEKYPELGLIVTVDNGIVANKAIDKASKLGVDVIISDHHQPGGKKPKAHSIVHTTKVSGSAVSWFLAREWLKKNKKKPQSIDLVAIGTVADQMPLLDMNRSFVKHGLRELGKTKRKGLLALFEQAHIDPQKIDTYEINFLIAPRINAAGRMSHAMEALRMLCTNDWMKSVKQAQELSRINGDRQKVVEEMLQDNTSLEQSDKIIIISGENYHEGVVGIAASKLVDKYYRPAIVGSINEGIVKASARSIEGFNIINALREFEEMLIDVGGHPMAAGFSLKLTKLEEFSNMITNYANEVISEEMMQKKLTIDTKINFNLLNYDLMGKINDFKPFGNGNRQPLFVADSVKLVDSKLVGQDNKHLKLTVSSNEKEFEAIAFGMGYLESDLRKADNFSIAFELDENIWNGRRSLQLKIRDIQT